MDEKLLDHFFPQYDKDSLHGESFSFCPAYGGYVDLSQLEETEQVRSDQYNTYCPAVFCILKKAACLGCENFGKKNPITLK